MRRWQCLIYNNTLKNFDWTSMYYKSMFWFLKTVYFDFWFLWKSDLRISCLYKRLVKLSEINTSESEKWSFSSTFFIRVWFQGYRCKPGVEIFACRVTWNYGYSPFKLILLLQFFFHRLKNFGESIMMFECVQLTAMGFFYDGCKNKTETLNLLKQTAFIDI